MPMTENPGSSPGAAADPRGVSTAEADAQAQRALLALAGRWQKEKKIHHAVDAYTKVITLDPASAVAGEAREALLAFARAWEKSGKVYAAANLYHLLARYYR